MNGLKEVHHKIFGSLKRSILSQREKDGYLLEWAVDQSLYNLRLDHQSNSFEPEEWKRGQRKGTDHRVKHKNQKVIVEDKNLNGLYFLNPSLFKTEVLDRFQKEDPSHKTQWVLIISIAKFGRKVLALIRKYRIKIVQIGFKVALENIEKAIQVLTRKLALLFRIRRTVFTLCKLCHYRNTITNKNENILGRIFAKLKEIKIFLNIATSSDLLSIITKLAFPKFSVIFSHFNHGWNEGKIEDFWDSGHPTCFVSIGSKLSSTRGRMLT